MVSQKNTTIFKQLKMYLKTAYKLIPRWSRFIIAVAGTITALTFLITGSLSFYNETIGEKSVAYQKISGLAAEEQIDYFNYSLGAPVFKNVKDGMSEYVYVNKYFYVQALCDSNDKVVLYSVTTKDKDFNPTFTREDSSYDQKTKTIVRNDQKIILGRTTFDEASNTFGPIDGVSSFVGVRRYGYSEAHYLGNPGNYQTFIFSLNDAGIINGYYPPDKSVNVGSFAVESENTSDPQKKYTSPLYDPDGINKILTTADFLSFRSKSVINTFTVTSPSLEKSLSKLRIGPDLDQVRVLNTLKPL